MKNFPRLFKAMTFVFSLLGLLSILNIVYLQPWSDPELGRNLQTVVKSGEHGPVVTRAAQLLTSSVPIQDTKTAGGEIPVSLGEIK